MKPSIRAFAASAVTGRLALLPVAALLAAMTLAFHGGSLGRVGFTSDSWHLLEIAQLGIVGAAKTILGYHISPVGFAFLGALGKILGDSETAWQAANLAGLSLCGVATYLVAIRLTGRRIPSLAAAVAFVAAAGPYEVPLWPLVGNFQSFGALLYLATLGLAIGAARQPARSIPTAVAFGLFSLASIFAYEPMLSVVFVGGLAFLLLGPGGDRPDFAGAVRRGAPFWIAGGGAFFILLVIKGRAAASGHQALFLPETPRELLLRVFWFERSFLSLFSLRGSADVLHRLFTFGTNAEFGTPLFIASAVAWGLVLAALTAAVLRRWLFHPVGFLVGWMGIHLTMVSIATSPVSRHYFLPQVPAAILLALLLDRLGEAIGRRLRPGGDPVTVAAIGPFIVALALVLLGAGARRDLSLGAPLFGDASRLTSELRSAIAGRLAAGTPPSQIVLVNFPALRERSGMVAFIFPNCAVPIALIESKGALGAQQIRMVRTYAAVPPGTFAHDPPEIDLVELAKLATRPDLLVLRHDPLRDELEELNASSFPVPAEWTPASAPWLDWRAGSFPWMPLGNGRPFVAPIDLGEGPAHLAIRALHGPRTGFRLLVDGRELLKVAPAERESWPTSVVLLPPRPGAGRIVRVEVIPEPEVWIAGLWGFEAPSVVDPDSAPFLEWLLRPEPAIIVSSPLEIPLARPGGASSEATLRFLYLAEPGRDFDLTLPGLPPVPLRFGERTSPAWLEFGAEFPAGADPIVLSLRPLGPSPPFVRELSLRPTHVAPPAAR